MAASRYSRRRSGRLGGGASCPAPRPEALTAPRHNRSVRAARGALASVSREEP
jgi:hypothetical protein